MESIKCNKCDKIIEGYTKKHVETLLSYHMIKHKNERNKSKLNSNKND